MTSAPYKRPRRRMSGLATVFVVVGLLLVSGPPSLQAQSDQGGSIIESGIASTNQTGPLKPSTESLPSTLSPTTQISVATVPEPESVGTSTTASVLVPPSTASVTTSSTNAAEAGAGGSESGAGAQGENGAAEPEGTVDAEAEGEAESPGKSEGEYPAGETPDGESEYANGEYAKGEGGSENEPESEYGGEHGEPAYAEPNPDFNKAFPLWGLAWPLHIYVTGTLFLIICIYSIASIILLRGKKHLLSKGYFISLNLMVAVLSGVRAIFFLVDAYNYWHRLPHIVSYILYSIVFPCITSAFSLLFLALLEATKMQVGSPRINKLPILVTIIGAHFTLSIVTDFVVGFFDGQLLLFVCQLFNVLWGIFLFIGFAFLFYKLYPASLRRQRQMHRHMKSMRIAAGHRSQSVTGEGGPVKPFRYTLDLAIKVVLASAILGLLLIGLNIYSMTGVYGVFAPAGSIPEPWPWWVFKTCVRASELGICITLSYVATQPFRIEQGKRDERPWRRALRFYCGACASWCRHSKDRYLLPNEGDWEELSCENESMSSGDAEEGSGGVHLRKISGGGFDEKYPLHNVNGGEGGVTITKPPMLIEEHGSLHWGNSNSPRGNIESNKTTTSGSANGGAKIGSNQEGRGDGAWNKGRSAEDEEGLSRMPTFKIERTFAHGGEREDGSLNNTYNNTDGSSGHVSSQRSSPPLGSEPSVMVTGRSTESVRSAAARSVASDRISQLSARMDSSHDHLYEADV